MPVLFGFSAVSHLVQSNHAWLCPRCAVISSAYTLVDVRPVCVIQAGSELF